MKLNTNQERHLPHVKWLIDEYHHIGEGRSMVLAMAVVEVANENIGKPIKYGYLTHPATRHHLTLTISQIIKENFPNSIFALSKCDLSIMRIEMASGRTVKIVSVDTAGAAFPHDNESPSNLMPSEFSPKSLVEIYYGESMTQDNDKTSGLVWFIRVLALGLLLAYFLFK